MLVAALAAMITHNSYTPNAACVAFAVMLWELLDMEASPHREWWLDHYVQLARELEGDTVCAPRGGSFPDFRGPLWQFAQEKNAPPITGFVAGCRKNTQVPWPLLNIFGDFSTTFI